MSTIIFNIIPQVNVEWTWNTCFQGNLTSFNLHRPLKHDKSIKNIELAHECLSCNGGHVTVNYA